jgi:hypothetical protein
MKQRTARLATGETGKYATTTPATAGVVVAVHSMRGVDGPRPGRDGRRLPAVAVERELAWQGGVRD